MDPFWRELPDALRRAAWDRFDARYDFRPGMDPASWPAIREPADSMTFDLSPIFSGDALGAAGWEAVEAEARRALLAVFADEEVTVLDWQHAAYSVPPGQLAMAPGSRWPEENEAWPVTVVPNGDYYAFLSADLAVGTFGHPWERTLCVIGEPMVVTLGRTLETWLPVLRRGGQPPTGAFRTPVL